MYHSQLSMMSIKANLPISYKCYKMLWCYKTSLALYSLHPSLLPEIHPDYLPSPQDIKSMLSFITLIQETLGNGLQSTAIGCFTAVPGHVSRSLFHYHENRMLMLGCKLACITMPISPHTIAVKAPVKCLGTRSIIWRVDVISSKSLLFMLVSNTGFRLLLYSSKLWCLISSI